MTRPSSRRRWAGRSLLPGLSLAGLVLMAGCASTASERTAANRPADALVKAGPERTGRGSSLAVPRELPNLEGHVLAEVRSCGRLPYNNLMLPLVSPDGRFIATQVGRPPSWELLEGSAGASVPYTSRIEIHALRDDSSELRLERIAIVNEACVLGRSLDDDGFIVEAPRSGGARWIGKADWETGIVEWIIKDAAVNAFGCLGPDGAMAYCRRTGDDPFFNLVLRFGNEELELPGNGADWLMPTFANGSTPTSLFVMLLRDGALDLVHFDAKDDNTVRQTLSSTPLSDAGADRELAYQALNASPAVLGIPRATETIIFQHPSRRATAAWRPGAAPVIFDRPSFAAVLDPANEDYVLVAFAKDLVRQSLDQSASRQRSKLAKGLHVPRATANPARPFIVFSPDDAELDVTAVRLVDPKELGR